MTIRWGLLGTARINRRLIPAIRASGRSIVAAVGSRDATPAAAFARQWTFRNRMGRTRRCSTRRSTSLTARCPTCTCRGRARRSPRADMCCAKSRLRCQPRTSKPSSVEHLRIHRDQAVESMAIEGNATFVDDVRDIEDAVLGLHPPRLSLQESRWHAATLAALYASAQHGQDVTLT